MIRLLGVFAIVCMAFASAQAQTLIGHYNQVDILEALPERDSLEKGLQTYTKKLEDSYQKMIQEYETKLADFQNEANAKSRPETVTEIMAKELQEMQGRIQEFPQTAQQDIMKRRETIFQPLVQKVEAAIKEVATEKGFTYVFDVSQGNPMVIKTDNDITGAIKTKLGI